MIYNGKTLSYYDATQQQRYIERQIRRWKREYRMMDAAGQDTTQASMKLAQWRATERDFCKQTGIDRDGFRSQMEGFGRSEASRATWDAKKQKLENIKKELISQVNTLDDMLKYSLNRYTGFDATQINSAILHGHIRGSIKNKMDLLDQADMIFLIGQLKKISPVKLLPTCLNPGLTQCDIGR